MPLDLPNGPKIPPGGSVSHKALATKVDRLNTSLRHHSATDVLRTAVAEIPDLALVSSFGAESVVLLHLASMVARDLPVLFVDTEMLFTETLVYQQELAERLALRDVRIIKAHDSALHDPDGSLHRRDKDGCCALRKTAPLRAALRPFGGWITGRKRFQSDTRAALAFFELEVAEDARPRIKINPLAHWQPGDVAQYIDENRLPRHPLVARGYPSIGCAPCTSPVAAGEDLRAGRWRDTEKQECGIHLVNGRMVPTGART